MIERSWVQLKHLILGWVTVSRQQTISVYNRNQGQLSLQSQLGRQIK